MILILNILVISTIVHGAPQTNRRELVKRQSCGRFNFECDDHSCIDSMLTCDGSRDCVDGSDETYKTCYNFNACPPSGFRCQYGGCIEASLVCNFIFDCIDGTDESDCFESKISSTINYVSQPSPCQSGSWICKSGECIDESLLCDGESNCNDASDETPELCKENIRCPASSFRCNYGACVEKSSKCDGIANCLDRSDENNEECSEDALFATTAAIVRTTRVIPTTHEITFIRPSPNVLSTRQTPLPQSTHMYPHSDYFTSRFSNRTSLLTKYSTVPATPSTVSISTEQPTEITSIKSTTAVMMDSSSPPLQIKNSQTNLQEKINDENFTNNCEIPEPPEGVYHKVVGCQTKWTEACLGQPGTSVPPGTALNYTCSSHHVRFDGFSSTMISACVNGKWHQEPEPCFRMCRALVSVTLDLKCSFHGKDIDCGFFVPHGTRVERSCKPNYIPINQGPLVAHCTTGYWTEPLFHCKPLCGIKPSLQISVQTLISNGKPTSAIEHPWHAALYSTDNNEKATKVYICGGSIISQFAILTAAHCVYDEYKKKIVSSIAIAVGKSTRLWDTIDPGQSTANVKRIYYQSDYRGRESNYQFDIAILEVEMLTFSSSVMPICLDLSNKLPPNGMVGIIVGFGLTKAASEDSLSDVLRVAELPLIDKESCRSLAPMDFRKYIGFDKFCAGHDEGTGIQRGDSGGGFIFLNDNVLFNIYGIVSVRQAAKSDEDVGDFTVFTNVADHAAFVTGILACIERRLEDKVDRCDVSTASIHVIDPP